MSGASPVTCSIDVFPSKENDELEVKDMTSHAHRLGIATSLLMAKLPSTLFQLTTSKPG
jgi:hypothetical protein